MSASFLIAWYYEDCMGFRVTEEQEIIGLDLVEHGTYGYPEQMKKAQDKSCNISNRTCHTDIKGMRSLA